MGNLVVWANKHFDKVMEARKEFDGLNPGNSEKKVDQNGRKR